jgi:CRISPR type IV-associated protein Csf2
MKITVSLKTITPYHSAPISGGSFIVTDEGKIVKKSSGGSGSPLTRTYQEPHYLSSTGEMTFMPVIRSMQILKALRSITTRNIYQSLQERDLKIAKISTYAGLEVGAASGKPAQMTATLGQVTNSLNKPIALFGGGSFSLKSILAVSDGILLHEELVDNGLVKKPAHVAAQEIASCESYQLTVPVPITRNDPINKINFSSIDDLNAIEDYQSQIKVWQGDVTNAQAKRKADAAEKKTDLNNLVACEAVVRGLVFVSELSLPENAGDAVKGAVLNALLESIRNGLTIGGRVSRGMGKLEIGVSVDGVELNDKTSLEQYEQELSSYSAWLDEVTPNELAEYFEK